MFSQRQCFQVFLRIWEAQLVLSLGFKPNQVRNALPPRMLPVGCRMEWWRPQCRCLGPSSELNPVSSPLVTQDMILEEGLKLQGRRIFDPSDYGVSRHVKRGVPHAVIGDVG